MCRHQAQEPDAVVISLPAPGSRGVRKEALIQARVLHSEKKLLRYSFDNVYAFHDPSCDIGVYPILVLLVPYGYVVQTTRKDTDTDIFCCLSVLIAISLVQICQSSFQRRTTL